jgi:hypothetical protein
MSHPCAGHIRQCDHCYSCDVLGICCATVSAPQRALLEASTPAQWDRLCARIAQEAGTTPALSDLIRQESRALPAATRLGLLAAPTANPLPEDSEKEVVHVELDRSK